MLAGKEYLVVSVSINNILMKSLPNDPSEYTFIIHTAKSLHQKKLILCHP